MKTRVRGFIFLSRSATTTAQGFICSESRKLFIDEHFLGQHEGEDEIEQLYYIWRVCGVEQAPVQRPHGPVSHAGKKGLPRK